MSGLVRAGRRRARAAVVTVVAVVLLVPLALPAVAWETATPPEHAQDERKVTVMTRNLYLGAPLEPLFEQETQEELVAAATRTWAHVQATDFPTRAEALAAEIADEQPHLVGLQEVSLYRSRPAGDAEAPETVELDFLALLREELAALGQRYDVAVVEEGFDGTLPILTPEGLRELRLTDREVILARRGSGMQVGDGRSGTFDAALELPLIPGDPPLTLTVERAWTSVDVRYRGVPFRFVNTHLEAFHPGITLAQAAELLEGPAATTLPVIMAGDFNSGPGPEPFSDAYELLTTAGGFTDADDELRPTCCFDGLLADPDAELDTHIDLVLHRGPFTVADVTVVGTSPFQATPPVWPSDHAGVVATLTIDR